ncbi:MAG: hypothetical protein KAT91_02355 [Candidatus Aenigmarchaeota archaeon]|nr:hypothetical protein [Candidatus Aenigmarchaeota archaeon]
MSSEAKQQSLPVVPIPGERYQVTEIIDRHFLNDDEINLLANAGRYIGLLKTIKSYTYEKRDLDLILNKAEICIEKNPFECWEDYTLADYTPLINICCAEKITETYQQIKHDEQKYNRSEIRKSLISEAEKTYNELKLFSEKETITPIIKLKINIEIDYYRKYTYKKRKGHTRKNKAQKA